MKEMQMSSPCLTCHRVDWTYNLNDLVSGIHFVPLSLLAATLIDSSSRGVAAYIRVFVAFCRKTKQKMQKNI